MTVSRRIVRIGCITLLVGLCLAGLTLSILPSLIESWILPQMVQQLDYDNFDCRIDHMGLTETSAGPLRFGPGPKPALTIERIRLIYNPASIAKGELDQIILSGITIRSVIDKGVISLSGLTKKPAPAGTDKPSTKPDLPTQFQLPALPCNRLVIKRSFLFVKTNKHEFQLPFSCTLEKSTIPESSTTRLFGNLQFVPRGTPVSLDFTADLTDNTTLVHLKLKGNSIELLDFADTWSRIPALKLQGQIALKTEADLNLSPLKLEKLQARIEWLQGKLAYNNLQIDNSHSAAGGAPPNTILTLNKNGISAPWRLQLNRLAFATPFSPTITNLEILLKQNPDKIDLQGHLTTRLAGVNSDSTFTLRPFTKKWNLTAEFDQQGRYKASLASPTDDQKWQLDSNTLSVSGQSPDIQIAIKGQKPSPGQLSWQLALNQTVINNSGNHWLCPAIKTEGHTKIKSANRDNSVLPVTATKGNLTCRKLILNQTDLGRINASFQQKGEKVKFRADYICKIIKELKLIVAGECGIKPNGGFQTNAELTVPTCKPAQAIVLGRFLPAAGQSTFEGTFSAAGKLAYGSENSSKLNGNITINLDHAHFNDPEKNIACSDINCRLKFPELPSLASAPGQKLRFAQLNAGNIKCQNGSFSFRLEKDQSMFIEKGRIGWCGGNVETQALRISPDLNNYQSTLYCDRLKLTELLKQLGQIEAQGQGSVNGRIPITLHQSKITFADGFLYSTPNQPGNIKITGGSALTAGIPTDSPQFAQLDLAREALKDYQYKWAKLKLNSRNDELILNLQFDGKPNLALPFIYKKEIGGFARITGDGPGSHFQGIRLDINLRLPLNHILQYKDLSNLAN